MTTNLRIMLVGKICGQDFDWVIAPQLAEEQAPVDGELQRLIDEAQDTLDYEEDMLDRMFWARGEW